MKSQSITSTRVSKPTHTEGKGTSTPPLPWEEYQSDIVGRAYRMGEIVVVTYGNSNVTHIPSTYSIFSFLLGLTLLKLFLLLGIVLPIL